MFIEAIQKLNLIKHKGKIKEVDKKELGELFDLSVLDEIDIMPPPANDSRKTREEIEGMIDNIKNLSDEQKSQYINTDDDTSYYIKQYMSNEDLDWDSKDIEKITDSARHIGRHFKNKFMRPRPYQLAKELNMDMKHFETDTSDSPSYPSNHALQARVVAQYYASIYPEHRSQLMQAAELSGQGRVDAGIHYPSDKMAGYQLADKAMKYFKHDILEDAPVNATGSAVSTDVPIVRKKKKYEPAQLFDLLKKHYK
jgi:acid phosphatase (class A)